MVSFGENSNVRIDKDLKLQTKRRMVNALVFPVAMYGCESWTVKKKERKKNDRFERWCWKLMLKIHGLQEEKTNRCLKELNQDVHEKC